MQAGAANDNNRGSHPGGGWGAGGGFAFAPPSPAGDSWRCGACWARNDASASSCAICAGARAQDSAGGAGSAGDGAAAFDFGGGEGDGAFPHQVGFPLGDDSLENADARTESESSSAEGEGEDRKRDAMEDVQRASKRLRSELERSDVELRAFVDRLDRAEERIQERFGTLRAREASIGEAHGDRNADGEDVIEINAGGKIIAAKRSTLCQVEGSRLAAVFGGRWDRKLQRDNGGRIFLDVNPKCFQAIVDYLNYLKLSPSDSPPDPPSVKAEFRHLLAHQIKLFGMEGVALPRVKSLDSNIIATDAQERLLHGWLAEDGSDGRLELLYRSSRDGPSGRDFHRHCDGRGPTLTVIRTTDGMIAGGYSNAPWGGGRGGGGGAAGAALNHGGFSFGYSPYHGAQHSPNHNGAVSQESLMNSFGTHSAFGGSGRTFPSHLPSHHYRSADKAFLFAFSDDGSFSSKMKVKHAAYALYDNETHGPTFGANSTDVFTGGRTVHDLRVSGSSLCLSPGNTYEPSRYTMVPGDYGVREMEVFRVAVKGRAEGGAESKSSGLFDAFASSEGGPFAFPFPAMDDAAVRAGQSNEPDGENRREDRPTADARRSKSNEPIDLAETDSFSKGVNKALNSKLRALKVAEERISSLENSLRDEEAFVDTFASGDAKDVVALNVSGTAMAARRSTLRVIEESALARRFDDETWTEQGSGNGAVRRVREWTHEDVGAWFEEIAGIPDDVRGIFKENEITGRELVSLGTEGLKMLGIERTGTLCLVSEEIKKLVRASEEDASPLIEHGPYCFGKILDYLRLKQLRAEGLLAEEPALPTVRDSERGRFEMTVNYFFPGESARLILG